MNQEHKQYQPEYQYEIVYGYTWQYHVYSEGDVVRKGSDFYDYTEAEQAAIEYIEEMNEIFVTQTWPRLKKAMAA